MTNHVLPGMLRSTLARVPVRGVPSLLHQITKLILGDRPRLLRVAAGFDLHIDPTDGDQCMMYFGRYGRGILHFAGEVLRSGDTVLDIGGQIGFFANAFADLVGPTGQVVTFEPDPQVWSRLLRGLRHSQHQTILARHFAITETSGTAMMHVSPTAGWSTLLDCDYPEVATVAVQTRSLDSLLDAPEIDWSRLRLIKLDIEGAELAALRGMTKTLARHRPRLICELNRSCLHDGGHTPDELLDLLRAQDYRVQAIVEPRGLLRGAEPRLVEVREAADLPWQFGDLLCHPILSNHR